MRTALVLAAALWLAAVCAMAAENPAELEQKMRLQLVQQPHDLDARFQLARALSWQERHAEALAEYALLLRARPDNADFLLGTAQVHLWSGAPEQSLPLLRKARRLAPKYEDVWRTQIQALLALGDADRIRQARLIRNEARTRFPRSEWTFSRLDAASEVAAIAEPPTTANVLGSPGAQPSPPAPASEPVIATQPVAAASPTPIPAPAPVAAATDKYELEAGVSYERLSGAINSWRSRYVVAEWRRPDRKMLYAGVRETDRFALDDREVHAGAVLPINPATQVQLEAGHSDTHRTLAARYGSLQLQYQPARGWLLGAGLRRSVYDIGQARVLNFSIDRYISAERFSYTLYEGAPDGSSLAPSHRWQWAHYYGDRDWIGITVIRGRETEYIGGTTFLNSAVSGASLSGRHSFNSAWALIWDAGYQSQGDFYTRSGVHLALRHAF